MTARDSSRPWLAVVLSLFYPGFGHAYLREWFRALVWFSLNAMSFTLLVPESAVPTEFTVAAFMRAAENIPLEATLALFSITVFSMVDAYWLAKREHHETAATEAAATCPNCGRDVDTDLDFCHWCTERIATEDDSGASA